MSNNWKSRHDDGRHFRDFEASTLPELFEGGRVDRQASLRMSRLEIGKIAGRIFRGMASRGWTVTDIHMFGSQTVDDKLPHKASDLDLIVMVKEMEDTSNWRPVQRDIDHVIIPIEDEYKRLIHVQTVFSKI